MTLSLPDVFKTEPAVRRWRRLLFNDPRRPFGAVVGFGSDGRPIVEPVRTLAFAPATSHAQSGRVLSRALCGAPAATCLNTWATPGRKSRGAPLR